MVPVKPKYQNSYIGELRGQFGVMCTIVIMESILGSTTVVVNSYVNISSLIRASIHPEAVTSRRKQANLIYNLSDVYHSIESGMTLVHVYRHHNRGKPVSNLTSLASINIRLDAIAENIMESFLLSLATRNTIAVRFSYPY